MTEQSEAGEDSIAQAITALVTAVRTPHSLELVTRGVPADAAAVLCHVITAVTANTGGLDALLAGRPGSWEADLIRRLVQSTAGEDPAQLVRYRTEPVYLHPNVTDTFFDFGLIDLHAEVDDPAEGRESDAVEALFNAVATPEERAGKQLALVRQILAIDNDIILRAGVAGKPFVADLVAVGRMREKLDVLWDQDWAAYRQSYVAAAQQFCDEHGVTLTVDAGDDDRPPESDPFFVAMREYARTTAPLPMTGAVPDWSDGTPADALRRAGLSYVDRIADMT